MPPQAIAIDSIAAACAMFAAALFVSWRRYVRETYVATFAAAFFAIAVGHLLAFVVVVRAIDPPIALAAGSACMVAGLAAVASGFRARAGRRAMTPAIGGGGALALILCIRFAADDRGVPIALVLTVYTAFAIAISARALVKGDAIGMTRGGTAFWLILSFIAYLGVQTALFATTAVMTATGRAAAELVILTGWSAGLIGIGLFTLLLIVEDLSIKLHRLALVDPLTGALNRRGVERAATPQFASAARRGDGLAVIVADLDRFKAINDNFGHALGDRVLRRFAAHLRDMVRAGDLVGRLGGEEFVIVIGGGGRAAAQITIERVRGTLAGVLADLELPMPITASYGVAIHQAGDTLGTLLIRADRALYGAKYAGRDRVLFAEPDRSATDERFRIAWAKQDGLPATVDDGATLIGERARG